MDLDFGRGFLPRIGSDNYKAVDRCLGPAQLFSDQIDLLWAVVDAAWAERQPAALDALRAHGTQFDRRHIGVAPPLRVRLRGETPCPSHAGPHRACRCHVEQRSGDPGASEPESAGGHRRRRLPRPRIHPVDGVEDLAATYETIIATVTEFTDVDAKPYFLYLGGHTRGPELAHRLIDDLPSFLSGVYVQLRPPTTATGAAPSR